MCISTDFKCPLLQNWFFFSFLMLCKNVYISKIFNEKEIGVQFHLPLNVLVHLSFFLKNAVKEMSWLTSDPWTLSVD